MATLSPLFPRGPIDVSERLYALPEDGSVPGMRDWKWIATPGHTDGHISLWRESDRTLISGDAVITTRQESAYAVATALTGDPFCEPQGLNSVFDTDKTTLAVVVKANEKLAAFAK